MTRTAACSCEQLTITVTGEPSFVAACSCLKCQRRTGSAFGLSSYFDDSQIIEITGDSKSFEKISDSGLKLERKFCPVCGVTVYWKAEFMSTHTGIPVGGFTDPNFPEPNVAVWNQSKHPWVSFPSQWPQSDTQAFNDGQ